MLEITLKIIMNIIRYDECNNTNMILEINEDIFFRCSFCKNCGNYTYKNSNKDCLSITCLCDRRRQIFDEYKNFILEIPDNFSGDELEDFLEDEPKKIKSSMLNYIYEMVLFSMTYEKNYHNKVNEDISDLILSFL